MEAPVLAGRVALVTGAARGLGYAIAEELARRGMRIAGLDIRGEELQASFAALKERCGVDTLAIPADLSSEQDVVAAVRQVTERFGPVYALVNNAGIRQVAPIWDTSMDLWSKTLSINLGGEFLCTREVLRQGMLERDEGRIIFISSIAGRRGALNSGAYSATKWGILGLAHSTALDLKKTGIRVTAITPGRTETPMAQESEQWNPDLGWLDPAAVAQAVAFCLSLTSSTVIPELHLHHRAEL